MGDLRNKVAKLIRDAQHAAYMARHYPPKPKPPTITCQCGNTIYDTKIWAFTRDRWSPTTFHCVACAPPELQQEIFHDMLTNGIRYDAAEHGDTLPPIFQPGCYGREAVFTRDHYRRNFRWRIRNKKAR